MLQMNEMNKRDISLKVIAETGIKTQHKVSYNSENIMCHCPYHKDSNPSMGINLAKGVFHCFSCGRSGSVETLYRDITGRRLFESSNHKQSSNPFNRFPVRKISYDYLSTPKKKTVYMNYDPKSLKPALSNGACVDYLLRRGISLGLADKYGMMYAEDSRINSTIFRDRLCIPIYENGVLSSIEGRRLSDDDSSPKVLYPKNTAVDFLFDIDNIDAEETVYACEGLMDLFVLKSSDFFSNSTCIFGANVTKRQLEQIKGFHRFIYIPDNDKAGSLTIQKLRDSGLSNAYVLKLPETFNGQPIKDIGDLPKVGLSVDDLLNRKWLNYIKPL